jgi:hypothetical protein
MARDLTLPLFSRIVGIGGMIVPNSVDGKGLVIMANFEPSRNYAWSGPGDRSAFVV